MTIKNSYTLTELTKGLDVVIKGDANCLISGVCPIQQSQSGRITFLTNSLYRKFLSNTQAAAVILSPGDAEFCSVNAVITSNAHFVYSQIAVFFAEKKTIQAGVHPTVIVGEGCEIDPTASVGAYCVLGRNVKLAAGVVIGANTCIGDESSIGENSYLDTRVTIYDHVRIGKRAHIYSGVVIGADGFGFAHQKNIWYKVPQLGSVSIGDDVDIGANTTIDRGAIEDTIIEDGVKLDNLIQIGHNVKIGAHTIIAGCVGIAGSAVIGKNCMIGGASLIAGHVSIHDNVIITGNTGVSKSLREPGIYSSGIVGVVSNEEFRKNNARFHRLENLMQRVKTLEGTLKEIKVRDNT